MKKNILTYLVLCTAVLISAVPLSGVSVSADAIPAVIEQNISRMDSISDHGAEFVVDYISESWDYTTVENILNEVKTLSDEVCSGCSDDYEKICAIANYVSTTISYDLDAKHNAVTFDVISLENVLEKKRTTCAGFSNLFSSMCNAQGLYCVNIRGSATSGEDGVYAATLDDENTVMNHEWTAVYYDAEERWVYVDCTWNSTNTYLNGEFHYGDAPRTRYLDISVETLSENHKAILVDHREFFDALTVLEAPATEPEVTTTTYHEQTNAEIIDNNQPDAVNNNSNAETQVYENTELNNNTTSAPTSSSASVSSSVITSETSVSESVTGKTVTSYNDETELITGGVTEIDETTEFIENTDTSAVSENSDTENKSDKKFPITAVIIAVVLAVVGALLIFISRKNKK